MTTLTCFMCNVPVRCKGGNFAKLENHLRQEHRVRLLIYFVTDDIQCFILQVQRGDSYLLAGCLMTYEEREAVRDVINEKIEAFQESGDDGYDTQSPGRRRSGGSVRYKCSHCPISFSDQEELREHLERKHRVRRSSVKVTTVPAKLRSSVVGGGRVNIVKNESMEMESEDSEADDPLSTSLASNKKKQKRRMMKKKLMRRSTSSPLGPRVQVQGRRADASAIIAGPDDSPGDGTTCPLCQKEFTSNAPMKRHFEDIHQPGEYPCKGCNKVFSSKNKVSSHYSRNCKRRTM